VAAGVIDSDITVHSAVHIELSDLWQITEINFVLSAAKISKTA